MPVTRGTAPTHCQHAVKNLKGFTASAIAQRGEVGNQTDKPEHRGDSGVRGDGKHVPHQRAAKLRPDAHRVGIWKQPVSQPRTAEVHDRIHAGLGHRKQRHGFSETVDRRAPLLSQQQQDRGDQGAGVTDSDPPDEVENVDSPGDGNVDAPESDTDKEKVRDRQQQQLEEDETRSQNR